MRCFNLTQPAMNDCVERQQDAHEVGMVELRASGPRYPRILATPAQVKSTTCQLGQPTCGASRHHASCLARPERSCEVIGNWFRSEPRLTGRSAS
jgi:hypothetical protein